MEIVVGTVAGIVSGFIFSTALLSRQDLKGPFWLGGDPSDGWWFFRAMGHHAAGWVNRIAVVGCMFVLTMQGTIATHPEIAWLYFVLYCPLAMLFLTNAAVRGYRIGLVEQELPRFLTAVTEGMREAIGDKTSAAFIDVAELLRVADQYGVPPSEIEHLIWSEND